MITLATAASKQHVSPALRDAVRGQVVSWETLSPLPPLLRARAIRAHLEAMCAPMVTPCSTPSVSRHAPEDGSSTAPRRVAGPEARTHTASVVLPTSPRRLRELCDFAAQTCAGASCRAIVTLCRHAVLACRARAARVRVCARARTRAGAAGTGTQAGTCARRGEDRAGDRGAPSRREEEEEGRVNVCKAVGVAGTMQALCVSFADLRVAVSHVQHIGAGGADPVRLSIAPPASASGHHASTSVSARRKWAQVGGYEEAKATLLKLVRTPIVVVCMVCFFLFCFLLFLTCLHADQLSWPQERAEQMKHFKVSAVEVCAPAMIRAVGVGIPAAVPFSPRPCLDPQAVRRCHLLPACCCMDLLGAARLCWRRVWQLSAT